MTQYNTPTLWVCSNTNTQSLSVSHNQTSGVIATNTGNIVVEPAGSTFTVPTGSTNIFGVATTARFNSSVQFGSIVDIMTGPATTTNVSRIALDAAEALRFMINPSASVSGSNLAIGSFDHRNEASWGIPASSNPTLWIFSQTAPSVNNTQWISLCHDTIQGYISTGTGSLLVDGYVGINETSPTAAFQSVSSDATQIPIIAKGVVSQSASLQEWQNNTGSALASITSAGQIVSPKFKTTFTDGFYLYNDAADVELRCSLYTATYPTLKIVGSGGYGNIFLGGMALLRPDVGGLNIKDSTDSNYGYITASALRAVVGANLYVSVGTSLIEYGSGIHQVWWDAATAGAGAKDLGIKRESAGLLRVSNGASGYGSVLLDSEIIEGSIDIDGITNNDAGAVVVGDVVVMSGATKQVVLSTSANQQGVGIATVAAASAATTRIATRGLEQVYVEATTVVAPGDKLVSSTTTGTAKVDNTETDATKIIGLVWESKTTGGVRELVLCRVL